MAEQQEVTRTEFARILGVRKSYVTKLAQAGRLVFTDDNRRVKVHESLKLIEESKDPNRDDVAARHAKRRESGRERSAEAPGAGEGAQAQDDGEQSAARSFSRARAEKEHYLALQARLSYEQQIGKLCETAAVRELGEELGVVLREALEALPDQMTPLVAPITDEAKIHAMLVEQCEYILTSLADRMNKAAAQITEQGESDGASSA